MKFLELKCPPPIVLIVSSLIAWLVSQRSGEFVLQQLNTLDNLLWPLVFVIAGIALALAGVKEFADQQTTVNPLDPNLSSSLVTSGVFQMTRNPMYLGMLLVSLGWADLLDNFLAYSGALIFFTYISAFQIKPEEAIMADKFGEAFNQYCRSVRRWL
jgi:protein-S-isoprenylcysteine O-methyltransferase Ste14